MYLRKGLRVERKGKREMRCSPVTPVVVRIDRDHADSRTVRTVFTYEAVRVWPVWGIFGHQGNSDCGPFQVVDGTLELTERIGQGEMNDNKKYDKHTKIQEASQRDDIKSCEFYEPFS